MQNQNLRKATLLKETLGQLVALNGTERSFAVGRVLPSRLSLTERRLLELIAPQVFSMMFHESHEKPQDMRRFAGPQNKGMGRSHSFPMIHESPEDMRRFAQPQDGRMGRSLSVQELVYAFETLNICSKKCSRVAPDEEDYIYFWPTQPHLVNVSTPQRHSQDIPSDELDSSNRAAVKPLSKSLARTLKRYRNSIPAKFMSEFDEEHCRGSIWDSAEQVSEFQRPSIRRRERQPQQVNRLSRFRNRKVEREQDQTPGTTLVEGRRRRRRDANQQLQNKGTSLWNLLKVQDRETRRQRRSTLSQTDSRQGPVSQNGSTHEDDRTLLKLEGDPNGGEEMHHNIFRIGTAERFSPVSSAVVEAKRADSSSEEVPQSSSEKVHADIYHPPPDAFTKPSENIQEKKKRTRRVKAKQDLSKTNGVSHDLESSSAECPGDRHQRPFELISNICRRRRQPMKGRAGSCPGGRRSKVSDGNQRISSAKHHRDYIWSLKTSRCFGRSRSTEEGTTVLSRILRRLGKKRSKTETTGFREVRRDRPNSPSPTKTTILPGDWPRIFARKTIHKLNGMFGRSAGGTSIHPIVKTVKPDSQENAPPRHSRTQTAVSKGVHDEHHEPLRDNNELTFGELLIGNHAVRVKRGTRSAEFLHQGRGQKLSTSREENPKLESKKKKKRDRLAGWSLVRMLRTTAGLDVGWSNATKPSPQSNVSSSKRSAGKPLRSLSARRMMLPKRNTGRGWRQTRRPSKLVKSGDFSKQRLPNRPVSREHRQESSLLSEVRRVKPSPGPVYRPKLRTPGGDHRPKQTSTPSDRKNEEDRSSSGSSRRLSSNASHPTGRNQAGSLEVHQDSKVTQLWTVLPPTQGYHYYCHRHHSTSSQYKQQLGTVR